MKIYNLNKINIFYTLIYFKKLLKNNFWRVSEPSYIKLDSELLGVSELYNLIKL